MRGIIKVDYVKLIPERAVIIDKTCIISDLHLGFENVVGSYGLTFPRVQIIEVIESLNKIIEKYRIKKLIIAGDLKHEFGGNLPLEWDDVELFLKKFSDILEIDFIRGNHDNFLSLILAKYGFDLKDSIKIKDWMVIHGHKQCDYEKIIMGHEHPAIKVRVNNAIYTYPCFLHVKDGNRKIIVLPAFSPLMSGVDVLSLDSFLSPILKHIDRSKMEIYATNDDEVLYLGKIENIRNILLNM